MHNNKINPTGDNAGLVFIPAHCSGALCFRSANKIMKIILLIIVTVLALATISSATGLTMKHKILVPDEYANGRNQEAFEGTSDIERYIDSFERKWWAVMNSYAKEINSPKDVGFICSGTPAASQGCADGYDAAMKRAAEFLKDHKPHDVQKFIKENIGM